ncbi:MAG: hypothetical protein V4750_20520 [Pseudomonadota bacterium]
MNYQLVVATATVAAFAGLVGCASGPTKSVNTPVAAPRPSAVAPISPSGPASVGHTYQVTVKGLDKRPVAGAEAAFEVRDKASPYKRASLKCLTSAQGLCAVAFDASRSDAYKTIESYSSEATVAVTAPGYMTAVTSMASAIHNPDLGRAHSIEGDVLLLSAKDYLTDDFLASARDAALREQALRFIPDMRLLGLDVKATLAQKRVGPTDYKGRKYLQLVFTTDNVYNSLVMSRYALGQRLFEESVSKVLTPLNTHLSNPKAFYGYDVVMVTFTSDFGDKLAKTKPMVYRFLVPQDTVRRYKDQVISGQQLIDQSVVLLDDERIDLKLQ